jgi:hypothetical protein
MSALKENMAWAKRAIQYVNKLGITSINVPFRLGSFAESPLSVFDRFMLYYTRGETGLHSVDRRLNQARDKEEDAIGGPMLATEVEQMRARIAGKIQDTKTVKSQILAIVHGTAGKAQKKQQLKDLMKRSGFNGDAYSYDWFRDRTDAPDEHRIRLVRKAIKMRHGNCGEKSAIAATWLLEQTKNTKAIFWVDANGWDHMWAVMANAGTLDETTVATGKYKRWPTDAVVVDGWTHDWYPIHHPYDPIKGTPYNPFQLHVRRGVQEFQGRINVDEELRWPPVFAPTFRMENAGKKNSTYTAPPKLLDVVDNPDDVAEEFADAQAVTT